MDKGVEKTLFYAFLKISLVEAVIDLTPFLSALALLIPVKDQRQVTVVGSIAFVIMFAINGLVLSYKPVAESSEYV